MSGLTKDDLSVIEGDARVNCRRLQEILMFANIGNLHKLILNHLDELEDYGEVFVMHHKNPPEGVQQSITI